MPQYDPYGAEQMTVGQTLADYATSPLRPSTYLGMWQMPGFFPSPSKGLWIPGIGKSLETRGIAGTLTRARSMAKAAYSKQGIVRGSLSLGAESVRRLGSFGTIGGGHVGGKWLGSSININKLEGKVASQMLKNEMYLAEAGKLSNLYKYTNKIKDPSHLGHVMDWKAGKKSEFQIWDSLHKKGTRNLQRYQKLLGAAKSGRGLKIAAKVGLSAGKVVSMVGAAMFAWDMISMVGEPLGRAAIRTLDNTLTEYNNRFMPETGGRLELSYLSQGAATERQRAIQAISKSYINGRSAFGSEASYMHQ
jgi:hypothetical protein